MCYSCATNPSIHHHCRCIVAMSLLLSHHGVAFAVALSWFHCHCHGVAFIVALSQFCHHCRGVTFVSVMVSSLLLRCRLHIGHSFIVAIMVSPSSSHPSEKKISSYSYLFLSYPQNKRYK